MPSALFAIAVAAVLALLFCQALPTAAQDDGAAVFYVSRDGDGDWAGRLPAPNAAKTDGPFSTLQRA